MKFFNWEANIKTNFVCSYSVKIKFKFFKHLLKKSLFGLCNIFCFKGEKHVFYFLIWFPIFGFREGLRPTSHERVKRFLSYDAYNIFHNNCINWCKTSLARNSNPANRVHKRGNVSGVQGLRFRVTRTAITVSKAAISQFWLSFVFRSLNHCPRGPLPSNWFSV